jgi:hypothetical protein
LHGADLHGGGFIDGVHRTFLSGWIPFWTPIDVAALAPSRHCRRLDRLARCRDLAMQQMGQPLATFLGDLSTPFHAEDDLSFRLSSSAFQHHVGVSRIG